MTTRFAERRVAARIEIPQKASAELKAFAKSVQQAHDALAFQHNQHDDEMRQALRGGISAQNNGKVAFVELLLAMPTAAPWTLLTPLNSFANVTGAAPLAVLMEPGGLVRMRGRIDTGASASQCAQLATGYSCEYPIRFPVYNVTSVGYASVSTAGVVVVVGAGAAWEFNNSWLASPAAKPHAFTGGNWPIIVNHGLDKCRGLAIESCRDADAPSGPAGAPIPDWEDIGNGQLRLNGVWGLQWSRRYTVRVRMNAET